MWRNKVVQNKKGMSQEYTYSPFRFNLDNKYMMKMSEVRFKEMIAGRAEGQELAI